MIPKFRFYHSKLNCVFEVVSISFLSEKVECIVSEVDNYLNTWRWSYGELLQSTGLKDKNGVEIFEGDILHHNVQGTGVVYYPFRDNMASFGTRSIKNGLGTTLRDTEKSGYEIIGNKYEHPHLLEE